MKNQKKIELQKRLRVIMHNCPYIESHRTCSIQGIKLIGKLEGNEEKALNLPNEYQLEAMFNRHLSCPLIDAYHKIIAQKLRSKLLFWIFIFLF